MRHWLKLYFSRRQNTIFRDSRSVTFNVREMLPKSGGLKVLRRPRILLLGCARMSLGFLKPSVDRLFGEEPVGDFPAASLPEL